jgi:mannose-6-phosphate isomerase-like protein (cupin superfamily)
MDQTEVYDKISSWLDQHVISLTEEQVLDFMKIRRRWPKKYTHTEDYSSLEIISYFSTLTHEVYRNDLFDGGGYLDFYKFKRYYDNGTTLMIVDVLDLTDELREINDYFQDNYGTQVQGNFYISGASTDGYSSFGPHDHHYDVFVKQIYGWSKWNIEGNVVEVNAGDVIVLPAGTEHQVLENSEKRLSLTINRQ